MLEPTHLLAGSLPGDQGRCSVDPGGAGGITSPLEPLLGELSHGTVARGNCALSLSGPSSWTAIRGTTRKKSQAPEHQGDTDIWLRTRGLRRNFSGATRDRGVHLGRPDGPNSPETAAKGHLPGLAGGTDLGEPLPATGPPAPAVSIEKTRRVNVLCPQGLANWGTETSPTRR